MQQLVERYTKGNAEVNVSEKTLGPVQTLCFCRAELNSGIKFDKSTAEARRLNHTFELSSALNKVRQALPYYTTLARQQLKHRVSAVPKKLINYINVFWRGCVLAGRTVTWLQKILNLVRLWHDV